MKPRLAKRSPDSFTKRYLEVSLRYILDSASNEPLQREGVDIRPTAYLALGQLVLAISRDGKGRDEAMAKETFQFLPVNKDSEDYSQRDNKVEPFRVKRGDIHENIEEIFTLTKRGLSQTQSSCTRSEALHCSADLVHALGDYCKPYIRDLLNEMFSSGLSQNLIYCLQKIASYLPSEKQAINIMLMEELSLSLAGSTAPVKQFLNPSTNCKSEDINGLHKSQIIINKCDKSDVTVKLVLSLRTLRSFGQSSRSSRGGTLVPFVRDVIAQYLSHPSPDVRRQAALTCCCLLLPEDDEVISGDFSNIASCFQTPYQRIRLGSKTLAIFEEMLQTLLRVAVSDPTPFVRHCILRAFNDRFDPYLCQRQYLPQLLLLLQDEALAVRAAALRLTGRLARLNPSEFLPPLRNILKELIIDLQCSGDIGGSKEAATRLLIVFLRADALHRLIHPFLHSIIKALPLERVTPRLASAALEALGELAQVVKESFKPWLHEVLPNILKTMQDQSSSRSSSSKQRASLRTLGMISQACGYVVTPYLEYPQLLTQAASVLPATKRAPWALRQEVIRTIGILGKFPKGVMICFLVMSNMLNCTGVIGALDPNRCKNETEKGKEAAIGSGYFVGIGDSSQKHVNRALTEDDSEEQAHLCMYDLYCPTAQPTVKRTKARRLSPPNENFYPTVALNALTKILKDSSLSVHHGGVMQAVEFIFNPLGLRCVPFLEDVVPYILRTVRSCNQTASLKEALLQQVAKLSRIVGDNLRPYVKDIFNICEDFWATKHLKTVLDLVQEIANGVPDEFQKYRSTVVSKLLSSIEEYSSGNWMTKVIPDEMEKFRVILKSLRNLRGALGDFMHLLIPRLLKLTESLITQQIDLTRNGKFNLITMTVTSLNTTSVLLRLESSNSRSQGFVPYRTANLTHVYSDSLPARSIQPLIRMLGEETNVGKEVGQAIVHAICDCAIELGNERWMSLYHITAHRAICDWHKRLFTHRLEGNDDGIIQQPSDNETDEMPTNASGISLYNAIIKEFQCSLDLGLASIPTSQRQEFLRQLDKGMPDIVNIPVSDILTPQPKATRHKTNVAHLRRAWEVSQRTTREDWDEWMRRFTVELLREAPAPALRATAELAHAYQPLARELFNAAFVCCWSELTDALKAELLDSLRVIFSADAGKDVSPEILQSLLNLAEFMEHDVGRLPIDTNDLAVLALRCRSYAKALHYKESQHRKGEGSSCIEDLISINKKLDLSGECRGNQT